MQREGQASRRPRARRGAIFVELGFVILLAYVFFAYTMSYARVFLGAQVVQNAVDTAARELSRLPAPANITFEDFLDPANAGQPWYDEFKARIYDEDKLVINLSLWELVPALSLDEFLEQIVQLPMVNKALVPLMIQQERIDGTRLVYPGAVVGGPSGLETVLIPLLDPTRGPLGEETIVRWARVLEEVPGPAGSDDPYQLISPEAGMVQLRVTYPFQSATSFSYQRDGDFAVDPNYAEDAAVGGVTTPPAPFTPSAAGDADADDPTTIYGGPYGLGAHRGYTFKGLPAGKTAVRPWRRVITAQAFYRREVFQ